MTPLIIFVDHQLGARADVSEAACQAEGLRRLARSESGPPRASVTY